jgi:group I intron endonuclease
MKKGIIYKITSPSGKIYIGQTINLKRRIKHYEGYKTNSSSVKIQKKLYRSFIKYGWENHNFEILEECTIEHNVLNEKEIYWIAYYESYSTGLNCTKGGEGTIGYKHTDETKNKIRETRLINNSGIGNKNNFGHKHSEKSKEQMSISQKKNKENKRHYGKKHSVETKEKMRKSHLNITFTDEHKNKISLANKGKIVSEETKEKMRNRIISEETKEKMRNSKLGKISITRKEVLCSNGEIYSHLKDASDKLGINLNIISKICNGKLFHYKGLVFRYSIDMENN